MCIFRGYPLSDQDIFPGKIFDCLYVLYRQVFWHIYDFLRRLWQFYLNSDLISHVSSVRGFCGFRTICAASGTLTHEGNAQTKDTASLDNGMMHDTSRLFVSIFPKVKLGVNLFLFTVEFPPIFAVFLESLFLSFLITCHF